jgi:hypothetical protein
VVSEETGKISIASNGILHAKSEDELKTDLKRMLSPLQNKPLFKARI